MPINLDTPNLCTNRSLTQRPLWLFPARIIDALRVTDRIERPSPLTSIAALSATGFVATLAGNAPTHVLGLTGRCGSVAGALVCRLPGLFYTLLNVGASGNALGSPMDVYAGPTTAGVVCGWLVSGRISSIVDAAIVTALCVGLAAVVASPEDSPEPPALEAASAAVATTQDPARLAAAKRVIALAQCGKLKQAQPLLELHLSASGTGDVRRALYAEKINIDFIYGRIDAGMVSMQAYWREFGEDPVGLSLRAALYSRGRREVAAERDFKKAAILAPNDPWVRYADVLLHGTKDDKVAGSPRGSHCDQGVWPSQSKRRLNTTCCECRGL